MSIVAYGLGIDPGVGSGPGETIIIRNAEITRNENKFTVTKAVNQFSVLQENRSNEINLSHDQALTLSATQRSFVVQVPNRKQVT
jgi:hypothetical protein